MAPNAMGSGAQPRSPVSPPSLNARAIHVARAIPGARGAPILRLVREAAATVQRAPAANNLPTTPLAGETLARAHGAGAALRREEIVKGREAGRRALRA